MASQKRLMRVLAFVSRPAVAIGGALIISIASVAFVWFLTGNSSVGIYSAVAFGPITEEVDVSGTVKASQNTSLSFQTVGQVASIHANVGDHVTAGSTLITLANETQSAAVALAKANLATQKARLDALTSGTRPEQISIDETSVSQAKSALENAIQHAYINADDAIHAKSDSSFSNPRVDSVRLIPLVSDTVLVSKVEKERIDIRPVLKNMHSLIASSTDIGQRADSMQSDLKAVAVFLNDLSEALFKALPNGVTPAKTIASYQTLVDTARSEVSGALMTLTTAQTAYRSASGLLALARSGATQNDIDAQRASVQAGVARLASAKANLSRTYLVAPISGTVSQQNAHLGETVSPGVPLVSIVADGKYQVDARVSEIDITKIHLGDPVEVTLASYPNKTFNATVTTVPPSATKSNGGDSYKIVVTFNDTDARIKPGLSANLRIITAGKKNVLLVPTSSIIANGARYFVYVKSNGATVKKQIKIGIQSVSGMTEITSGLNAGDVVLSFGTRATNS
ncbi:MAG TPA: efflux RND transporter periplasmic adaptor subunit [Candidatus Kaiserbacteria bacterium]|nr:efflux RND transporter periplasmic adaptor subunit [Candidatus Kaiserbacteria bacterium]